MVCFHRFSYRWTAAEQAQRMSMGRGRDSVDVPCEWFVFGGVVASLYLIYLYVFVASLSYMLNYFVFPISLI